MVSPELMSDEALIAEYQGWRGLALNVQFSDAELERAKAIDAEFLRRMKPSSGNMGYLAQLEQDTAKLAKRRTFQRR
jgi:fatty acid-binding protein DegV